MAKDSFTILCVGRNCSLLHRQRSFKTIWLRPGFIQPAVEWDLLPFMSTIGVAPQSEIHASSVAPGPGEATGTVGTCEKVPRYFLTLSTMADYCTSGTFTVVREMASFQG